MEDQDFKDLSRRVEELEAKLKEVEPMVKTYQAGGLIIHILFVLGGILVGVSTFWLAFGGWLSRHIR